MLVILKVSSILKLTIMKQLIAIFTSILLTGFTANATTSNHKETNSTTSSSVRGYGNSFIFQEEGIEFSVFPDGQFDFYMTNYGPNVNVSINTPLASISFNSGFDYNAFVQYDEFGAIVQIEHVPVYYDYYGRVSQLGNVCINYNNFGYVTQVGGLYVHYNRYNRFSHCSGFINVFNRFYVARPWHSYYRIPHFNHCVVYNRPYRQYYRPIRHQYTRPYVNNYRRTSAVASRRGNTVNRRSELATRGNDRPRNSVSSNSVRPRSATQSTPRPRVTTNTPRPNAQTKPRTQPKPRVKSSSPRPNAHSKPRTQPKPRITTSTSRPKASSKPRTQSKPRMTSNKPRPRKQIARPSRSQKSKGSQIRNYSGSNKSSSKRIASNSKKRR